MSDKVDILILGAGWTSTFLIPLCEQRNLTFAATSRTGRDSTIQFSFDPDSENIEPYKSLPNASTVLITFPIEKEGASERLVKLYCGSRNGDDSTQSSSRFVQLGTTSMWGGTRHNLQSCQKSEHKWYDRRSPYTSTPRAQAEDELLRLSPEHPSTVLNLSGLWGGSRLPKNWVGRVAPSKEALKTKAGLHMIHGMDVARCILAVHEDFDKASGQRWLLTDGRIYDWWDLASAWGTQPSLESAEDDRGPQPQWTKELMQEAGIRILPRNLELLGRVLDSQEFWTTFKISPLRARLEEREC
ncbi:hypothetical protein CPB83DRAFT_805083 [Crepidotus variabilis]|uniref:Uncharacterized protein n=1 Tax=Crepidotus variabilis TaxID=179855 RepID=A0A9P6ERP2_9AGAR|nr:hypothetical protein CPB83DRAFT_805083 [Crepidotus variabilis]